MAKVTWSVPLVQFGRCELEFDPTVEGLNIAFEDPEGFGREYADFVAGVMKGFERRQAEIRGGVPSREAIDHEMSDGDHDTEASAIKAIKNGLGATEVPDDAPPWERKNVEKSEPWKSGGPVKKPAKIQW